MVKRTLGRGLSALLGANEMFSDANDSGAVEPAGAETQVAAISAIVPNPYQPRREFVDAELESLAQSIRVHGVIQPVLVRRVGVSEQFQIVAGERRFRAAQRAGLSQVPVRVLEIDDRQTFELALVENLQREDLNPVEKARAFESYLSKYGATHEELASQLGLDRSTVTNLVRLLELPEPVLEKVRLGQLSNGHARALLSLNDSAEQINLCRRIVTEGLSVRQTEDIVRGFKPQTTEKGESRSGAAKSNHILSLEEKLRQQLGTKVEIKARAKDKGSITIQFQSNDDFERIMDALLNRKRSSSAE